MELRVLLVEDNPDDAELALRRLREAGIEPLSDRVAGEAALREALARDRWDVALVDYNLPGFGGLEALRLLAATAPDLPAITVSGAISEDTAVATITAGAVDYVLKDNLTRLAPAVERAVEGADLRRRQRRATEQARQSQFAVDHASQAIVYVSEDGVVLYANEASARLGGVPPEEAVGRHIWGWIPLVDERRWAELWRVAAEHSIVDFETTLRHVGGEERVVTATIDLLERDGDAFAIVYIRDISEQRTAEERARETEARYGRLTDNAADIIFRYDLVPQPGITYINPAVEAITGYSPEECYADPQLMLTMIHPDDASLMEAMLRSLEPPEEPLLLRWIGKDGVTRWTESRVVPVRDADGRLLAVEGITRDVNERVHAEEALERRLVALTSPLDDAAGITIDELFNRRDLQQLQDEFARATGVASIITDPGGTPITAPSSFCRLCNDIIRTTDKGRASCYRSDAVIGQPRADGPTIQVCESGGLWDAGAAITVGGRHIANWLIGQVRDATQSEEKLRAYAREIGADEDATAEAFRDVPAMSREQFGLVAQAMFTLADQLSRIAYQNVQQARFITERKQAEDELLASQQILEGIINAIPARVFWKDMDLVYLGCNAIFARDAGFTGPQDIIGKDDYQMGWCDQAEAYRADDHRVIESGVPESLIEEPQTTPEGNTITLLTSKLPLLDSKGAICGVIGTYLDITERKQAEEEIRRQAERLKRIVEGAVLAMSNVVEARDPYTAGHERRVSELATAIGAEMGMTATDLEGLRLAGLIHDIGKIAVPAEILSKPGRLSVVEFNLIKQHAQAGYDILAAIEFDQPVAQIALQHHERRDGSGYPQGLSGEDILPEARILAVADVVEAMSSHRPYRAALGIAPALAEIRENAGVEYDPEVAAACLRVVGEQGFQFTP